MHTGHISSPINYLSNGILYNHESPSWRKLCYPKNRAGNAASIAQGKLDTIELGNLDIERDWGYAPDYVRGMWLMLQQEIPPIMY